MIPILRRWNQKFSEINPKFTWGIPLGLTVLVSLLFLSNLLWVSEGESPAEIVVEDTPAPATEASPGANENSEGPSSILGEAPDQEVEPSLLIEVSPGNWEFQKRAYIFTDLDQWRVIWIGNHQKLDLPLAPPAPDPYVYQFKGDSGLIRQSADTQAKTELSFDRSRKRRYSLQLASLPADRLVELAKLARQLFETGQQAYLYRSAEPRPTPKGDQYFYSLRIGFFESDAETTRLAEVLQKESPDQTLLSNPWPVYPDALEKEAELIDFRVQRNRPWSINFGGQNNKEKILTDLAQAAPYLEHCFVLQRKGDQGYGYRLKGGFFESQEAAQAVLDKIRRESGVPFAGARLSAQQYKISQDKGP